MRIYLPLLTILVAAVGVIEAILFQFMGDLVNWINTYSLSEIWAKKAGQFLVCSLLQS